MRVHHILAVFGVGLATLAAGCQPGPVSTADDATGEVTAELVGDLDWGQRVERQLEQRAFQLFGFREPIGASAPATSGAYRRASQPASAQVELAKGLHASYLTREIADSADMFAFWPDDDHPTHLIFCIESGREELGASLPGGQPKLNPSVQSVRIRDGRVTTILRGMSGCDGIRNTGWGTILATEEEDDGGAYEIIDPLHIENATVVDRGGPGEPATITDPRIVKRTAMPAMAWEGIAVLPSGVVIGGDELRPGSGTPDADGGAMFKFVPAAPRVATGPIRDLAASPLVAGDVYALQVSCVNGGQQLGQGCEIGKAAWIPVEAATARGDANALGATGYYRPEDLEWDREHRDRANPAAVRFCWNDTGNEGAANYAELMCAVDVAPLTASSLAQTVVVNRFIEGDPDFNSFDNLAFQPRTRNVYVVEDHPNGDIFACLDDGRDRDVKSDGCVKMLSVKDSSAEPTGFKFAGDGTVAFLSIQHSSDSLMSAVDDFGTDDIIMITGFVAF